MRKRTLNAELAEARRHLRAAEAEVAAEARNWRLEGHSLRVAMGIYLLTDCSLAPTITYLEGVGCRKKWPKKSHDELSVFICDEFAAADDELLVSMLSDTGGGAYIKAQRAAYTHIIKWRTKAWNEVENRKGTLPSTVSLLGQLEAERMKIPEAVRPLAHSSKNLGGVRKQGSRLRSQIGAQLFAQPTKDDLPPSELRSKAASVWQWHNHLCSRAATAKKIVRINWDETAVCLFPGAAKGSLVISKDEFPAKCVPKAAKRTYFT